MALEALLWGLLSAVSLPLGAVVGLAWRPGSRWVSAMMAFGAGALLFALSVELMGDIPELVESHGRGALAAGLGGALVGGLLFDLLNQLLNNRGAFLRNLSNAERYVASRKRRRALRMLKQLVKQPVFQPVAPEQLADLLKNLKRRQYKAGEVICRHGDSANHLYLVRRGAVELEPAEGAAEQPPHRVREGEVFGELAVVLNRPRQLGARAVTDTTLYMLADEDVQDAMAQDAALKRAMLELARRRASAVGHASAAELHEVMEEAEDELEEDLMPVTEEDIRDEMAEAAKGAAVAMAIWLGIAIDAVPESLVIGTLAIGPEGMSLAFIAGVFLANFPEAMSSAIAMRNSGMGLARIMTMWSSIFVLTGVGALLGAVMFPAEPEGNLFFLMLAVEGLAAGAMLTAIAESMLPEAFEQGGSIVGMMTLLGFLAALSVAVI